MDFFNEAVVSVEFGFFKSEYFCILNGNQKILGRFGPVLFHIWFGRYWAEGVTATAPAAQPPIGRSQGSHLLSVGTR